MRVRGTLVYEGRRLDVEVERGTPIVYANRFTLLPRYKVERISLFLQPSPADSPVYAENEPELGRVQ